MGNANTKYKKLNYAIYRSFWREMLTVNKREIDFLVDEFIDKIKNMSEYSASKNTKKFDKFFKSLKQYYKTNSKRDYNKYMKDVYNVFDNYENRMGHDFSNKKWFSVLKSNNEKCNFNNLYDDYMLQLSGYIEFQDIKKQCTLDKCKIIIDILEKGDIFNKYNIEIQQAEHTITKLLEEIMNELKHQDFENKLAHSFR